MDTLTVGSLAELERSARRLANEMVTEVVNVIEPPSRRKLFPASPVNRKEVADPGEPVTLMDFTSPGQAAVLDVKSTPDMKAKFLIDSVEGSPNPVSAKLVVVMSETTGGKSFASGRIAMPEPVAVGEKKAFALRVKGKGIKTVRIAAQEQKGSQYILWEKRGVPVGADWSEVSIPFADCDIWLYDSNSRKYTRFLNNPEPKNITEIRAFVQPANLTDTTAMLWVDSISLR